MRFVSFFAGLALLVAASAAQAGAPPIGEQRSFIFSGDDCTVDCIEGASAFLTVQEFDFEEAIVGGGVNLGNSFIVDFGFTSDSGVFDGFDFLGGSGTGILLGIPDEQADITINGAAFIDGLFQPLLDGEPQLIQFAFQTSSTGAWSMEITGGEPILRGQDDVGLSSAWNPVSEPGAFALLGIGLIGLVAVRRRQRLAA